MIINLNAQHRKSPEALNFPKTPAKGPPEPQHPKTLHHPTQKILQKKTSLVRLLLQLPHPSLLLESLGDLFELEV